MRKVTVEAPKPQLACVCVPAGLGAQAREVGKPINSANYATRQ
ncbi:hypothetical protein AB0F91_44410 [Amycolatopsis sp. NPDC023774]